MNATAQRTVVPLASLVKPMEKTIQSIGACILFAAAMTGKAEIHRVRDPSIAPF